MACYGFLWTDKLVEHMAEVAARVAITPIILDDFLTRQRTLRSDVLDRLASLLGYELQKAS